MATDSCSCEERKRRLQGTRENGDEWKPKERRAVSAQEEAAVAMFQELLRIRTVSFEGPNGAYREAVDWLTSRCKALGLETREVEPAPGKPTLLATWHGEVSEAEEPAVLLNSHYDVVPALPEH
eukprot:EG_transcript_50233